MRVNRESGTDNVEASEKVLTEPQCGCSESGFAVSQELRVKSQIKTEADWEKPVRGRVQLGLQAQPGSRASCPCDSGVSSIQAEEGPPVPVRAHWARAHPLQQTLRFPVPAGEGGRGSIGTCLFICSLVLDWLFQRILLK